MSNRSKSYERKVYSLLDMLGNVGGLSEVIQAVAYIIVYIILTHQVETKFVQSFQNNIIDYKITIPDQTKVNRNMKLIQGRKF